MIADSVVDARRTSSPFHIAAPPFPIDARLLGRSRRPRSPARLLHLEPGRQLRPQPLECQFAIAGLGSRVGCDRGDHRTQPLEQAGSLARAEGHRILDPEADLDPRVGRIGVLSAGTTRAADPPLEFRGTEHAGGSHPKPTVIGGHAPTVSEPDRTGWLPMSRFWEPTAVDSSETARILSAP